MCIYEYGEFCEFRELLEFGEYCEVREFGEFCEVREFIEFLLWKNGARFVRNVVKWDLLNDFQTLLIF